MVEAFGGENRDPNFEDMSFLKLTNIFFGLLSQQSAANASVLRKINERIMSPSEPKPIVSIMRVLDKICRDPELIVKFGRTMDLLSSHF